MKTIITIIIFIFLYLLGFFITAILSCYWERINGSSEKTTYKGEEFNEHLFTMFIGWSFFLPILLILLSIQKIKIWVITITEYLIIRKENK